MREEEHRALPRKRRRLHRCAAAGEPCVAEPASSSSAAGETRFVGDATRVETGRGRALPALTVEEGDAEQFAGERRRDPRLGGVCGVSAAGDVVRV